MINPDEIIIEFELEWQELADPKVRDHIKSLPRQLEEAGIGFNDLVRTRSGAITASTLPELGPYLVPLASVAISGMTTAFGAWLAFKDRKISVKFGDTVIVVRNSTEVDEVLKSALDYQTKLAGIKKST